MILLSLYFVNDNNLNENTGHIDESCSLFAHSHVASTLEERTKCF